MGSSSPWTISVRAVMRANRSGVSAGSPVATRNAQKVRASFIAFCRPWMAVDCAISAESALSAPILVIASRVAVE